MILLIFETRHSQNHHDRKQTDGSQGRGEEELPDEVRVQFYKMKKL